MKAGEDEQALFTIAFSFEDLLGCGLGEDPNDFVTEYRFTIKTDPDDPAQKGELVGKGKLSLIQFSLALDAEFPLRDVMDATPTILGMSESLFSWDENTDPFDKLYAYFGDVPPINLDICFVEQVEVLPRFRGKGIGRAVVTSIAQRFYNSCGLIVVKAFPLQHQAKSTSEPEDDWKGAMCYDELEQDFERSQYQLFHWYKQMGMDNPFDPEYFIARPHQLAFSPRIES